MTSGPAAEPVTITPPPCTAGYFSSSGDAPCTAASPGYYVSGSGAKSQTACPLGYYQPCSAASSCDEASPGRYVDATGSSAQHPCTAGYYQPDSGASSCIAAGLGYFVATSGQAGEVACPAGETTLMVASTACVAPTTLTASSVNKEPGLTVFSARLTLTLDGKSIGGQTIVFKIGSATVCTAVTASNGTASCSAVITLNKYSTRTATPQATPATPPTSRPPQPAASTQPLLELAGDREAAVVLTAPWHERDTRSLVEHFGMDVFSPSPDTPDDLVQNYGIALERIPDGWRSPDLAWLRTANDGHAHHFGAGDVLPIGVAAFPGRARNDLVLWIASRRAIVTGDALVDFGRGFEIPPEVLQHGATRNQVAQSLRPLLDLRVDLVLPAHGHPTDRAALERALS